MFIKPLLFSCGLFFLLPLAVNAQQLPLFTQYREMSGAINPAIVSDYMLAGGFQVHLGSSIRMQWVGREGAPRTQMLHGEWFRQSRGSSFGILAGGYALNDQAGKMGFTGLYGRIASVWLADGRNPDEGGFAAGLAIGVVQFRIALSEGDVMVRDADDPVLEAGNLHKIHRDVAVGAYGWRLMDGMGGEDMTVYGGVSIPQALGIDLFFKPDSISQGEPERYGLERVKHYYGLAGLRQFLQRTGSYLDISTWVKYVPHAPLNLDINLRLHRNLDDVAGLWIGAGVNTAKTFHTEIGIAPGEDENIRIGYSYDFNFSNKTLKFGNSHEINVAVLLGGD